MNTLVNWLPTVNASLNGTAAVLLVLGYVAIKQQRQERHKKLMWSAVAVSTLFLISYVTYHTLRQRLTGEAHTRFTSPGLIRQVYLAILFSHLVLAIAILPMVLVTLYRGVRAQFQQHAAIARWTLPIWLYVSVTGVVVYWMLYHMARPE